MKSTGKNSGIKNLRPPWKPGQSGNPKGHPKGVKHWRTVFQELFEQGKISQEAVCRSMAKRAAAGDHLAAKIMFDRMDGHPNQPLSLEENEQSKLIPVDSIPPELRIELAGEIIEQAKKEIADRDNKGEPV